MYSVHHDNGVRSGINTRSMAMDVLLDEKNEGETIVGMKGGGYEAPMMKNELVSGEELLYELGDDVDASDDAENGEMG